MQHHAAILDAIRARDPEAARRAMEEHLRQSGIAAAGFLQRSGYWDTEEAP